MTLPAVRVGIGIIGQSNERGKRQESLPAAEAVGAPTFARFGAPVSDPILPKGDDVFPASGWYGSMWPKVAERMWLHGRYWMTFSNHAIGGSSWVIDWAGDSSGDGTGAVYVEGDGGFDPNSYIADAYAGLMGIPGVSQRWIFMANGQNDAAADVTLSAYRDSIGSIVEYFVSREINVAIGLTHAKLGTARRSWMQAVGKPAVDSVVGDFASDSRAQVIHGGDLYTALPNVQDVPGDPAHMDKRGYDLGSDAWSNALIAGGW